MDDSLNNCFGYVLVFTTVLTVINRMSGYIPVQHAFTEKLPLREFSSVVLTFLWLIFAFSKSDTCGYSLNMFGRTGDDPYIWHCLSMPSPTPYVMIIVKALYSMAQTQLLALNLVCIFFRQREASISSDSKKTQ